MFVKNMGRSNKNLKACKKAGYRYCTHKFQECNCLAEVEHDLLMVDVNYFITPIDLENYILNNNVRSTHMLFHVPETGKRFKAEFDGVTRYEIEKGIDQVDGRDSMWMHVDQTMMHTHPVPLWCTEIIPVERGAFSCTIKATFEGYRYITVDYIPIPSDTLEQLVYTPELSSSSSENDDEEPLLMPACLSEKVDEQPKESKDFIDFMIETESTEEEVLSSTESEDSSDSEDDLYMRYIDPSTGSTKTDTAEGNSYFGYFGAGLSYLSQGLHKIATEATETAQNFPFMFCRPCATQIPQKPPNREGVSYEKRHIKAYANKKTFTKILSSKDVQVTNNRLTVFFDTNELNYDDIETFRVDANNEAKYQEFETMEGYLAKSWEDASVLRKAKFYLSSLQHDTLTTIANTVLYGVRPKWVTVPQDILEDFNQPADLIDLKETGATRSPIHNVLHTLRSNPCILLTVHTLRMTSSIAIMLQPYSIPTKLALQAMVHGGSRVLLGMKQSLKETTVWGMTTLLVTGLQLNEISTVVREKLLSLMNHMGIIHPDRDLTWLYLITNPMKESVYFRSVGNWLENLIQPQPDLEYILQESTSLTPLPTLQQVQSAMNLTPSSLDNSCLPQNLWSGIQPGLSLLKTGIACSGFLLLTGYTLLRNGTHVQTILQKTEDWITSKLMKKFTEEEGSLEENTDERHLSRLNAYARTLRSTYGALVPRVTLSMLTLLPPYLVSLSGFPKTGLMLALMFITLAVLLLKNSRTGLSTNAIDWVLSSNLVQKYSVISRDKMHMFILLLLSSNFAFLSGLVYQSM
jgi:hypothetical protein